MLLNWKKFVAHTSHLLFAFISEYSLRSNADWGCSYKEIYQTGKQTIVTSHEQKKICNINIQKQSYHWVVDIVLVGFTAQ